MTLLPTGLRVAIGVPTRGGMTISIYDMDRTITRGGTWTPWLRFWLRREAPWRVVMLPLLGAALLGHGLGLMTRGRLKEIAHRLVMGRRVARERVAAAAAGYAARVLATGVFPGALAAIAGDRAAGQRLVLATASNAYYARAIAAALGIDNVVATQSHWVEEQLDYRLGDDNCYGEAKCRQVTAWLNAAGLSGQPFRFYSDHVSDLPLFELAVSVGGEAVAANPSAALRGLAMARGWQVVDWGPQARSWLERA